MLNKMTNCRTQDPDVVYAVSEIGNDSTGRSAFTARIYDGLTPSLYVALEPFRTVQEVIRVFNDMKDRFLSIRTGEIIFLTDITENTNSPIFLPESLYLQSGLPNFPVQIRTWTITGSYDNNILHLEHTRLNGIRINVQRYVIEHGCLATSSGGGISVTSNNRGGATKDYGIVIKNKANVNLEYLSVMGDKCIDIKSGSLNIKDGELYINSVGTASAILIENEGKMLVKNSDVTIDNDNDKKVIFEVYGSLDSNNSEYVSEDVFLFHNSHSGNVYHNEDILDIPSRVSDKTDNSTTRSHYIDTIFKGNNTMLANKNNDIYSIFTTNGKILTSGGVNDKKINNENTEDEEDGSVVTIV
ncbi:Hypothetical protein ORPV_109 [Orpheovirus IHUMI-LCC2]|uniref:Uncharacterized protein n=1 Tax=Orpheovirus IHUMI-LCC2 TaxID=2023057 RepID=A0A2I2L3B1_9VIRU|nr:Hypothetical protein ORPV_109 [Orpheovirus IHUMI-LCC2]SNW62013.1 Hypothetical protein ORPV_109 [Orpheovirus IHUMI-LCC2]